MAAGSAKTGSGTTTMLYDGQNLIAEQGTLQADFVFGPNIDEPLAMSRNAAISYYNADSLGSISELNDPSGNVQNSYVFDAWGVTRSQSGSTISPFGYTSREFAESGLLFYRARYYNPGIGRFASEDPLTAILPGTSRLVSFGINGASSFLSPVRRLARGWKPPDPYLYVRNNSINFVDPMGLQQTSPGVTTPSPSGDCPPNEPCLGLPGCNCDNFCSGFCDSTGKKWDCEYWVCDCYHSGKLCKTHCELYNCDFGPRGLPNWEKPDGCGGS